MTFKQQFFDLRLALPLILLLLPGSASLTSAQSDSQGAFYTGKYPNLLKEWGLSDEEIQARIDATWEQLFYGDDDTERVYYPVGDYMAYVLDVNNADIRSEGMSYGMMIAVQMDKKEEFDRIWTWAKTYMYQEKGKYAGYFAWHNRPDGSKIDEGPAPDGETWFVTALFFAAARWGNGEGIYNYEAQANAILNAMLHKSEENTGVTDMFDPEHKMVVFVPEEAFKFTDPSYHTPHYYELWARWAEKDNDFWYEAARVSREFFHLAAHPETGLMPDYAEFTGEPRPQWDYGEYFYADAWRCAMNVAVDYTWFAADPWQVEQTDRLQAFFYNLGIGEYANKFLIDGEQVGPPNRSTGLVATNAIASLAASTDTKWAFIEELWNTPIPSGRYRYYDGLLYFMALLHLSGNFQIYALE
jgi:oligosaccharide reducing-end xylanase